MISEKTILKPNQLRLRDVVRLESDSPSPWASSTVIKIRDGKVTLFRPYMITSDFETLSGVIPYIGMEEYEVLVDDTRPMYELLERPSPPR